MITNLPNYISWKGFSYSLLCEAILFHLLMQAMEVEEHFHVQHACATPSDLSYFKRNKYSQGMTPLNDSTASYCEKLHSLGELQLLLKTGDGFFGNGLHGKQTGAGF